MANKQYIIGIDVGGTNMKAVLFNGEKTLADYQLATPKDTLEHFLIMMTALIEPLLERARKDKVRVAGIGLGVAGVQDYENGRILRSPNIKILDGVRLVEILAKRINLPVKMDNDAKCFIRAEAILGEGKKYKNIFGITLGTGIGGGWWYKDEVYHGAYGGAGEPGEMIMNSENEIGLEEAYHKITQGNPAGLADEAYRGDVLAGKTYTELGRLLGIAFANIVNLIDPEIIVIIGSVMESGDLFLPQVKKTMREHIESDISRKKVRIALSKLNHAGAIGAALLFREVV